MANPPDRELLLSYRRYILAKVQAEEFRHWGGEVLAGIRSRISEHEEMERRYIEAMIAERAKPS